ncbi:MAG TPA: hypothetical protein VGD29_14530 [Actinoplanes sp.]|jgi:hypothetical protein
MLVQLNQTTAPRDFSITATGLPVNPSTVPAQPRGPHPVVAVVGRPGRVAGLAQHLPGGWSLRYPAGVDDVLPGEIVLLAGTSVREVGLARAVLPARTRVVALVDGEAPAEVVAGVLTAGADVCVRGGQPAILASHLVACRRRDVAQRWARIDADRTPV